jgi:predicted dehydrogenase
VTGNNGGLRVLAPVRWGIIGCGDVTEVKSGPAFQKAERSSLVAVMRRDRARAEDYARRHGVPRAYDDADALIADPEVDAVYVATPPSTHRELALRVAAAGKPCLVEKPMAMNHAECVDMVGAFAAAGVPVWVAYYRRALPRFVRVRELLASHAIGRLTSVHISVQQPLATAGWRVDPDIGGGLMLDLGSHCVDLIDFLIGPITDVAARAVNTAGGHRTADVVAASFRAGGIVGGGLWNFNAFSARDLMIFTGDGGEVRVPIFTDGDVELTAGGRHDVLPFRNPPHVHQPLVQAIVDELCGVGRCESTGESGARASWVLDRCLEP